VDWDAIFASREWGRYPAEDLIRFVAREQRRLPSLKALEIGCGPGANLCFLAGLGIDFDAIDSSPNAVRQAITRLDVEHPGWKGRVVVGDIRALPADFEGYDIAIDSQALSCLSLDDSAAVIASINERIYPEGAFWSRTFAAGTWPGAFDESIRLTQRDEIAALYGECWSLNVGEITRHDGEPGKLIREWIITARKS
jgi:SAM-dependent methyltransferase